MGTQADKECSTLIELRKAAENAINLKVISDRDAKILNYILHVSTQRLIYKGYMEFEN